MSHHTFNCTLVEEDSVVVDALPNVSGSVVEISAVASVGDGVWLSLDDTKELHAALGAIIEARDVVASKKIADELEPGDWFEIDGVKSRLLVTATRTSDHRTCLNISTNELVQVRWSQPVQVCS